MYFPTICVDNFLNRPDELRNYALSLDYYSPVDIINTGDSSLPGGTWPGKRTKSLHIINPQLFNDMTKKIFSCFYNFEKNPIEWNMQICFQKISANTNGGINVGRIHHDNNALYAGLLYLSPDIDSSCGTSLFKLKKDVPYLSYDGVDSLAEDKLSKNDQYFNYNPADKSKYQENIEKNNSNFQETLTISNVYNRLIGYDGKIYHGVKQFGVNDDDERLTMVFFVYGLTSNWFPIPNSKRFDI